MAVVSEASRLDQKQPLGVTRRDPASPLLGLPAKWFPTNMTFTVDVPDTMLRALDVSPAEASAKLRLAAAMKFYELGELSSGAAAELAGIPKPVFLSRLADFGIEAFRMKPEGLAHGWQRLGHGRENRQRRSSGFCAKDERRAVGLRHPRKCDLAARHKHTGVRPQRGGTGGEAGG